jgi:integrase
MATLRRRGSKWHVQVRRSGHTTQTRSFSHKADAEAWSRKVERQIDSGEVLRDTAILKATTVYDLLRRYQEEVLPNKRSASVEHYIIERFLRHPISGQSLATLKPLLIGQYRDMRLCDVKSGTVLRELAVLRHCFQIAIDEWGVQLQFNPVNSVNMPKASPARTRRAAPQEIQSLLNGNNHWLLSSIILFAIETGMRRGEIVNASWNGVGYEERTLHIPITKNGSSRTIPRTDEAMSIIEALPQTEERIFPISGNVVRLAWERLKRRVVLLICGSMTFAMRQLVGSLRWGCLFQR